VQLEAITPDYFLKGKTLWYRFPATNFLNPREYNDFSQMSKVKN